MGVCIWVYEKERDRLKQRDNAKQRKYNRQKLTNMKRENNTFIRYFKNVFLLDLKIFTFLKCKFFIISSPQCLLLYMFIANRWIEFTYLLQMWWRNWTIMFSDKLTIHRGLNKGLEFIEYIKKFLRFLTSRLSWSSERNKPNQSWKAQFRDI